MSEEDEHDDFVILTELPQMPIDSYKDKDEKNIKIITVNEALKKIMQDITQIKEAMVGNK